MNRIALFIACAAACQHPSSSTQTSKPTPAKQYSLLDVVGEWRWIHRTNEAGTSRVEDETWRLRPEGGRLAGRYLRTVEVRSTDGSPFLCNQRPWYRQRAIFDVSVEVEGDGLVIKETKYDAEQSPCDHGFRHVSNYRAQKQGNRLVLNWDKGTQTLWQVEGSVGEPLESPWRDKPIDPTGPWRWQTSSYDDDGNVRDELEWWEITRRTDTRLDATYRRRVTVRNPEGKNIVCANAPSWSYDDAYILEGQREEEHWHFYEVGVEPGDHPCTRITPRRTTDEATAEQIGDFFIFEWRGKRRQILYRAE